MTNVIFSLKKVTGQGSQVKTVCMIGKLLSQETYMPNKKALSETIQKS